MLGKCVLCNGQDDKCVFYNNQAHILGDSENESDNSQQLLTTVKTCSNFNLTKTQQWTVVLTGDKCEFCNRQVCNS